MVSLKQHFDFCTGTQNKKTGQEKHQGLYNSTHA